MRRADEGFDGFTLIELLIVIVVLGILAATVIFALGGVQGQSAQAACNSDAKSVETAVEAYHNDPANNGGWPTSIQSLVNTANSANGYLRAVPNNSAYSISTDGQGGVFVNKGNPTTPTQDATTNYDTATTNPCSSV
jgi:general secretion pathway protein G